MRALRVGVIGCGNICPAYLQNLTAWPETPVVALADLDSSKAKAMGERFNLPALASPAALLARDEVDAVLNLTVPDAHYQVARAALEAGKHVYNEKPLALDPAEGSEILQLAESKNLRVGCAPDTFLGAGIQTCRALIESGGIGRIVGAQAFMLCPGHESWHPSPEFYYKPGGGPMFDMGPYYLTALVELLGPMKRVVGLARTTSPTRTITSEPLKGTVIEVETPTHISGLIEFVSGAVGQISTSFDVVAHGMPHIEVYGTEGTIRVPDPNGFGGQVLVRKRGDSDWQEQPHAPGRTDNARGLGLLDMAQAIAEGRSHRASGSRAQHVLQAMAGFVFPSPGGWHDIPAQGGV